MFRRQFRDSVLAVIVLSSCGYSITRAEPTTTTSTTTTTTLDLGASCNTSRVNEFESKLAAFAQAKGAIPNYGIPTKTQLADVLDALRAFRTYTRGLDVPTLVEEQSKLVEVSAEYISAFNRYFESDYRDLYVNEMVTPFIDALTDFQTSYENLCY